MRQTYNDDLDNTVRKMFNVNRDYINQEINRLGTPSHRDTKYRRGGMLDFGARQMLNLTGEGNFAIVGFTTTSPVVGA